MTRIWSLLPSPHMHFAQFKVAPPLQERTIPSRRLQSQDSRCSAQTPGENSEHPHPSTLRCSSSVHFPPHPLSAATSPKFASSPGLALRRQSSSICAGWMISSAASLWRSSPAPQALSSRKICLSSATSTRPHCRSESQRRGQRTSHCWSAAATYAASAAAISFDILLDVSLPIANPLFIF